VKHKTEPEVRQALREWVIKTSGKIKPEELDDATPIIERRIISSVHVLDLILFLEELGGKAIDVGKLKVGVFRNIDTIYRNFFAVAERPDGG
jgi:hypothetical protein